MWVIFPTDNYLTHIAQIKKNNFRVILSDSIYLKHNAFTHSFQSRQHNVDTFTSKLSKNKYQNHLKLIYFVAVLFEAGYFNFF